MLMLSRAQARNAHLCEYVLIRAYSGITKDGDDGSLKNEAGEKTTIEDSGPPGSETSPKAKLTELLVSLASKEYYPSEKAKKINVIVGKKKPRVHPSDSKVTEDEKEIGRELVDAARDVAQMFGDGAPEAESELLSSLRSHTLSSAKEASSKLSELISGMNIEKSDDSSSSRMPQRRALYSFRPSRVLQEGSKEPINLYGSQPLGIFPSKVEGESSPSKESSLSTWDYHADREKELLMSHPPANAIEEMILWTKQGKLWKFPIDNEVGLEEEKKVGFHEHVFLEQHISDWCPSHGPIKQFMELVCVGLSKNPYITVKRKMDHINWYRDYFTDKKDMLKAMNAW